MGGLEQIGGTETVKLALVIASTLFRCHRCQLQLLLQQRPHQRILVGFHSPRLILVRRDGNSLSPGFLKEQLTKGQSPGRRLPGRLAARCRMMLDFPGNLFRIDFHPIDPHDTKAGRSLPQPRVWRRATTAPRLAGAGHYRLRPDGNFHIFDDGRLAHGYGFSIAMDWCPLIAGRSPYGPALPHPRRRWEPDLPDRSPEWSFYRFSSGNGQSGNQALADRKSTRLNSSHVKISYAVFCLK